MKMASVSPLRLRPRLPRRLCRPRHDIRSLERTPHPRRSPRPETGSRVALMDAKLVEFSNLLRQNGLRVSLAESMDMLRALAVVGLPDHGDRKSTLRATMVKRSVDLPIFETLFDLFFSGLAD